MAEGGVVRVKVDIERVLVIQRVVLPPQLYVGDLQGIANGLDSVGAGALGRPEDGHHPKCQLVTGWKEKERRQSVAPGQDPRRLRGESRDARWRMSTPCLPRNPQDQSRGPMLVKRLPACNGDSRGCLPALPGYKDGPASPFSLLVVLLCSSLRFPLSTSVTFLCSTLWVSCAHYGEG